MTSNQPSRLPRPSTSTSRAPQRLAIAQALQSSRPPCSPPTHIGNREAHEVRAMLNQETTHLFNGDASVRNAVLRELKPLLVRVRHPSERLLIAFLTSLTSFGVDAYDTTGGHGPINTTASAFDATVKWLRQRTRSLRNVLVHAIGRERIDALLNGSYLRHPVWSSTLTPEARAATGRIWNSLISPSYVRIDQFIVTDAGYRALQLCIQDVWLELDNGGSAAEAFSRTTWRTAGIHVPSQHGWDVGTSLQLTASELNL